MSTSRHSRQAGLGHIITVAVIVLVFSAVGYIGFKLYAHPLNDNSGKSTAVRETTTTLNNPAAPEIKTASDLDKASAVLDQVDPGSASQSDETVLNSQLNGF